MELNTLINLQFGGSDKSDIIFDYILFLIFIAAIVIYIYFRYIQWKNREIYINDNFTTSYIPDKCPDYWVLEDGTNVCNNVNNIGTNSKETVDFSTTEYTGSNGNLNKCNWSNTNNIPWTGIDNLC